MEARLGVADILDRKPRQMGEIVLGKDLRAPHLARDDDAVRGGKGLAGHTSLGIDGQEGVHDLIGDAVAHLVRMAFGDRLARETIGFADQVTPPALDRQPPAGSI
jgi:hypothetical protein